jgi:hypothetical protein
MTLNNSKYIEILEFVLNGKSYREIEKLEGVSKNTVANLREVGGIPPLFVLDNMRIARKFSSKKDADIRLTSLFENLCNHYDFKVRFCSPYCPNQKGNVENSVAVLKREFEKSYINSFDNIEEIREFVNDKISELNTKEHPQKNDSCENLFNHEKNRLLPLPNREYIYYHKKQCKVNSNGMIKFNHNYYAVPEMYKGEKVIIKYNDSTIYILTKDKGEVLAKYTPAQGKKNHKFRIWYMLNKLKNKSNGFMYSKEYLSLSKPEKLLLEKIFKNDCNEFLTFIELLKNRPRDLIRKFVYKFKDNLDFVTVDLLMSKMLKL